MVNIKSELESNQTVLLMMPSMDYNQVLIDTLKSLAGSKICYATSNKTYDSLQEIFQKNKVNVENIVFVDAISKTIKKTSDKGENVYYISSPGALTELSLVIGKFLGHEFDFLIFDSLTNLGIYQKPQIVAKFISSLVNKIKKGKTKAVFYVIGSKTDELIKIAGTFVDKVVDVEKISPTK